ncbi:unnamed protein product [Haemonchus placei]|uniref:Reverse transcriptase domain-containing protein n=1 Tax=Haemonchus placei TaxID=6290 RepID=A0A0N4WVB5_HAEPC|nr:unnamed protein product [Haemonchus placei]
MALSAPVYPARTAWLPPFLLHMYAINWLYTFLDRSNQLRAKRVPQGGSLSPLLFLTYSYELVQFFRRSSWLHVAAHADDIKVSVALDGENKDEAQHAWCSRWGLVVNRQRTCMLSWGFQLDVCSPDGCHVKQTDYVKDLGVRISNDFKWRVHINDISRKGLKFVHLLCRAMHTTDSSIWIELYKMHVLPLLEHLVLCRAPPSSKAFRKLTEFRNHSPPNADYPRALPSYQARLQVLKLGSHPYRRIRPDLILALEGTVHDNFSNPDYEEKWKTRSKIVRWR